MKKFKFTIKGQNYDVNVIDFNNNIADIEVNGTPYQVEVQHEVKKTKTPTLVRPAIKNPEGAERIQKALGSGFPVLSPLPGSIIKIFVSPGDAVKKGDNMMIMEAMKMENNVLAEKDGVINSVKVAVGQSVLQGDVLLEIG
ncbi:MAG: hypothetical protein K9J13_01995 [Saprospiraceae bacterium]|nr:hypothetical protein [Saprospiraceae bacterium]